MRLSDQDIRRSIDQGEITILPSPIYDRITGVSIDLRLGHTFRTFRNHSIPFIDLGADREQLEQQLAANLSPEITVGCNELFFLHPQELTLASTYESIALSDQLVGWLDGRSSLARLGLFVHVTAHRIDPGWDGKIVLELYNTGNVPLGLRPLMPIAAISFEWLLSATTSPYIARDSAKYRYQNDVIGSRMGAENATSSSATPLKT